MTDAADPLAIHVDTGDGTTTIRLDGELDVHTAPALSSTMDEVLGSGNPGAVTLDASGLSFCDSSGIQVLVQAKDKATSAGGTFSLTGVHGSVAKVLGVTGLLDVLTED